MNKKIIKFLMCILILNFSFILNAESSKKRFYKGVINNKYKIQMEFYSEGSDKLNGSYFYESSRINITIQGTINQKNKIIELKEFDYQKKQTGIFKGKLISESKIEGRWFKPDGSKELPFSLEEVKIPDYIDLSGYWSISSKNSYDFDITLNQTCLNINGYHNGMTKDASRIDAVIIEDGGKPSIKGTLQGKTIKGTFRSGYSEATGEFLITIINEKEISWKITKVTDGEIFIPSEATLKN